MTLTLGLLLFAAAHLWRRLAPASRAALGDAGKGVVALASVAGIWLMARGYGAWDDAPAWWGRSAALTGVNNLLVAVAFYLFVASGARTAAARAVRHPQLLAVVLWAAAHLLVNGDAPSLLLFGGLGLWALLSVALISRGPAAAHVPGPALVPATAWGREAAALALTAAALAGAVWLHGRIGPWPLG